MKSIGVTVLDHKDEQLADGLRNMGMNRTTALAVTYLKRKGIGLAIDFERATGLRQPEVSIAMRELKEKGWVSETDKKKIGKGRPNKVYKMTVNIIEIISTLEAAEYEKYNTVKATAEKLRMLAN